MPLSEDITALVLAGGLARRLGGQDKGLLIYKNKPLIEHALAYLSIRFPRICISANRNIEIYQKYSNSVYSDILKSDTQALLGPLAGIHTAMSNIDSPYLFVYACDLVDVSANIIDDLLKEKEDYDVVVAQQGDKPQYLLSVWNCALVNDIQKSIENEELAVYQFLKDKKVKYIQYENTSWQNINSLEQVDES